MFGLTWKKQTFFLEICVCLCVWAEPLLSLASTVVMELFPLFWGHVVVCCARLTSTTYCVPPSHWTAGLSTTIIPSKTCAVIPAMFHQSVAIYSKAHCLNMLATAKITARGCLCVRAPAAILLLLLKLVIPLDDSRQKEAEWTSLRFSGAISQWSLNCSRVFVCVCVCGWIINTVRHLAATHPSHTDLINGAPGRWTASQACTKSRPTGLCVCFCPRENTTFLQVSF